MSYRIEQRLMFLERLRHVGLIAHPGSFKNRPLQRTDRNAKLMMFANGLKLLGAASICFGINPFLGYTLVGVGAAAYSPAKYGILGELTTGSKLVKANGLMEASTIASRSNGLRIIYSVTINMVPNHLDKRAHKYLGMVRQASRKYGVDESLILAIMQTESSFKLNGINCFYGAHQALFDITLDCPQGETLVLLGPSGAGKSSLLRV